MKTEADLNLDMNGKSDDSAREVIVYHVVTSILKNLNQNCGGMVDASRLTGLLGKLKERFFLLTGFPNKVIFFPILMISLNILTIISSIASGNLFLFFLPLLSTMIFLYIIGRRIKNHTNQTSKLNKNLLLASNRLEFGENPILKAFGVNWKKPLEGQTQALEDMNYYLSEVLKDIELKYGEVYLPNNYSLAALLKVNRLNDRRRDVFFSISSKVDFIFSGIKRGKFYPEFKKEFYGDDVLQMSTFVDDTERRNQKILGLIKKSS